MPDHREPTWHAYYTSFRTYAHQLIAWGYQDARSLITSSNQEEEITGAIANAANSRLNAINAPEWLDHFCVKEEVPTPTSGRTGKRRLRIDVLIECSVFRPRHKYTFEAKRLMAMSHPIKKYTGVGGLQMYLSLSYAADEPEAAMLGYMQNHNATYWIAELQKEFDGDTTDELRIRSALVKCTVLEALPDEWQSVHERDSGSLVDIYHILLDCT